MPAAPKSLHQKQLLLAVLLLLCTTKVVNKTDIVLNDARHQHVQAAEKSTYREDTMYTEETVTFGRHHTERLQWYDPALACVPA